MAEWKKCKIGDVAELVAGFAFKSNAFGAFPDKVIKITNIDDQGIFSKNLPGVDLSGLDKDRLARYIVREGDYVLAMTGSLGKIGKVVDGEAYINQRVLTIRTKGKTDKRYLYYVLKSSEFLAYVLTHIDSHSVQANISAGTIGEYEFELPPLPIQRKIAAVLGALDDKIETNRKICANLEAQAQALFKSWFVDFEPFGGKMPKGWKMGKLGDAIAYQEGPGIRNWQYVEKDGTRFINIRCINDGEITTDTANMISNDEANGKYAHFMLKENDIVMSCSGTLGRYAVVRKCHLPLCLNTSVIRFYPKRDHYDFSWILGYLGSADFLEQQKAMANGSCQVNFGPTHLKQMQIVIPEEAVRKRYHEIVYPLICQAMCCKDESRSLAAMRDALLPKLMSGEIDVSKVEVA